MLNKFIKTLILVGFGVIILPTISFGQIKVNTSYALSNELGVEIIPNYPKPNKMVFINLTLYTNDLNSALITWYKDGKKVLSGKGKTKYSFRTANVGKETKIETVIKLLNGSVFSKVFTLNPANVDLTWEANSYTPPFYKGKALHPKQGSLKVVATPEFIKGGKIILPQNLIYKWSNGLKVYQEQSGYGKNVIILNGSILGRNENIKVLVTDPVNNLVAESFVNIKPINPEIVFYKDSPYYGPIFNLAIANNFNLKAEETQILAAPYYFTKENINGLKYEWRLNNQVISNLSSSRTAIFRKPKKQAGKSLISLQVQNLIRILQQADRNLTISFSD